MTRLWSIVVDARDHIAQARWWAEALGTTVTVEQDDVASLTLPSGLALEVVPVPEAKTAKNRIHLDLATSSPAEHEALVERLVGSGATRIDVGQPADCDWVVLADPEGNELCVLEPRPDHGYDGPVAVICVETDHAAGVGDFWERATGWSTVFDDHESWVVLRHPSGTGPYLSLRAASEPKVAKNRLHPDVAPVVGADLDTEVAELVRAGGRRIDIGQGDVSWVVLADPGGNELCVLSPR